MLRCADKNLHNHIHEERFRWRQRLSISTNAECVSQKYLITFWQKFMEQVYELQNLHKIFTKLDSHSQIFGLVHDVPTRRQCFLRFGPPWGNRMNGYRPLSLFLSLLSHFYRTEWTNRRKKSILQTKRISLTSCPDPKLPQKRNVLEISVWKQVSEDNSEVGAKDWLFSMNVTPKKHLELGMNNSNITESESSWEKYEKTKLIVRIKLNYIRCGTLFSALKFQF